MYLTVSTDGDGEISIIISKEKTSQRAKDLETDGATQGYSTHEIEEDQLYTIDQGSVVNMLQGEKLDDDEECDEYEWLSRKVEAIKEKDCNEGGGTFSH